MQTMKREGTGPLAGARAIAAVLLGAALLCGCRPVEVRETDTGAWTAIPPGSTLTLSRPIQVPQDRARVFFLAGEIRPAGASLGPSCALEIRTISRNGPHRVAAGTYRIARVENYWTQVAWREPLGAVRRQLANATSGGGNPMIQEGYHLYLAGGPDPDVMRLTCLGMLADMWRSRPITLAEIRKSLGSIAALELAAPAAARP